MDRNAALELLTSGHVGIQEWNIFRERGGEPPVLEGVDLQRAHMRGVNLTHVNMRGANLRELT